MRSSTDQRPKQGQRGENTFPSENNCLVELFGPPLQTERDRYYFVSVLTNCCVTSVVYRAVILADQLRKRQPANRSVH